MNLKLNMGAYDDVLSSGSYLYNEILFSQTNRREHPVVGISILVREIGDPDNMIIVDIHKPLPKHKFECIENSLSLDNKIPGTITIEVGNKIFQSSVSGMSPEENTLIACISLLKALRISKVFMMENNLKIPSNFLDTGNYIGQIFKKIA